MSAATATPPGITWQMLAERPNIVTLRNYIVKMHHRLQVDLNTCIAEVRETTRFDKADVEAAISLVEWEHGL